MSTNKTILIIDNETSRIQKLLDPLSKAYDVKVAYNYRKALEIIKIKKNTQLALINTRIETSNDTELYNRLKNTFLKKNIPLLVINHSKAEEAFEYEKNYDYITDSVKNDELLQRVNNLIDLHFLKESKSTESIKESIKIAESLIKFSKPTLYKRALRIASITKSITKILYPKLITEFENTAKLSQIGCMNISHTIIAKTLQGHTLTDEELQHYQKYPENSALLLEKMPNLKHFAEKIRFIVPYGNIETLSQFKQKDIDECLLPAAIFFEESLNEERLHQDIIADMLTVFPKKIAETFNKAVFENEYRYEKIPIEHLMPGLFLAENLVTDSGVEVMKKGKEVTETIADKIKDNWLEQFETNKKIKIKKIKRF